MNNQSTKIITIEDPIEKHIPRVQQTQVHLLAGKENKSYNFADGIKTCLRQDADVIMLGEVRDSETANVSVQAALTGHLILTTVHAIRSDDVISRLKSMGVETYLLASAFNGVIAQRLVKKLCPNCREKIDFPENLFNKFNLEEDVQIELQGNIYFTYGKGCENCHQTGIVGRVGVYEVLTASDTIKELIFHDASTMEIRTQAIKEGMQELKQQYVKKAVRGEIALEELIQAIYDFS